MRIGQIILRVADLDESVAFWTERVGLELTARAGTFAFLSGGDIQSLSDRVGDVGHVCLQGSDQIGAVHGQ